MPSNKLPNTNQKKVEKKLNKLWEQQIVEALLFSSDKPLSTAEIAQLSRLSLAKIKKIIENLNADYKKNGRCFFIYKKVVSSFLPNDKKPTKKLQKHHKSEKTLKKVQKHTESPQELWQMRTLPELGAWLKNTPTAKMMSLSPKVMETLTIIAYRQPITKADVDKIRNADSSYTLSTLLKKNLIKMRRSNKIAGRPLSYQTNDLFLTVFGFSSLKDLPNYNEINSIIDV